VINPRGNAALGVRIRSIRQSQGHTLADIATASGVSLPYVSEVERGAKLPTLEVLTRLADALELTVVELLSGVHPYDGK
jgi:transcriptional regulator with XRE-family HTH domain